MREYIQLRAGAERMIEQNPSYIDIATKPLIPDANSGFIEDPFGVPVISSIRCRISGQKTSPATLTETSAGFSDDPAMYILVAHDITITRGQAFDHRGSRYEIGPVIDIVAFGEVVRREASLKKIKNIAEVNT